MIEVLEAPAHLPTPSSCTHLHATKELPILSKICDVDRFELGCTCVHILCPLLLDHSAITESCH